MKIKYCLLIISALFLGGCSLSPKIQDFSYEASTDFTQSDNVTINDEWWKAYNDETLNIFVDEALKNNKDLQIAMLNIESARATLTLRDSDKYPSLSAQAGATRTQTSDEAYTSRGSKVTYNDFSLSAVLSYEVDLWGRISSLSKSARASLFATKASKDTVRLSLISSVVDAYFNIVSLNEQLNIVNETVASREESVNLTKVRYEAGAVDESILSGQQSLLSQAKITKDSIEQSLSLASTSLGILLGRSPSELMAAKDIKLSKLPNDIVVPDNIPSSIIENRPDIEASYQQLISSNELIGVNKAAYFPTLSLSALFGFQSDDISNLFNSGAKAWNLGGNLVAPLINFGKTRSNVELAEIAKNIAVIQYEQSVTTAFSEVYNALNSRNILSRSLQNSIEFEGHIQKTVDLTNKQYDAGYVDYLSVLDAKRTLLSAQLSTIQTKQQLLSSGVSLFKALGGGWDKSQYRDNN
ncbi:MAG: efflux transporter outer membrane subunit [Campylobacteraceae bacterium]